MLRHPEAQCPGGIAALKCCATQKPIPRAGSLRSNVAPPKSPIPRRDRGVQMLRHPTLSPASSLRLRCSVSQHPAPDRIAALKRCARQQPSPGPWWPTQVRPLRLGEAGTTSTTTRQRNVELCREPRRPITGDRAPPCRPQPNVLTLLSLRRSIETRRQECTRFSVSQRAQKIPH
jgi:hypothetical protein